MQDFYDHFKYMSENCESNVKHNTGIDICEDDTIFEELDFPITIDVLYTGICILGGCLC